MICHTRGMPSAALLRLFKKLGLFYLLALSIALAALIGFTELADEVMEAEFRGFDRSVLLWVNGHVPPDWTPFVRELSFLGSPLGISLLGALFGVLLLARRQAWDAATLLVLLLGGGALTFGLKQLFRQPRPDVFPPLSVETGFGFPSGHALLSVCFFGYVAFWVAAQGPRAWWRWGVALLSVGMALLIALSRLYLGVHWPTDVAAGGLAALFWLSCCLGVRRWVAAHTRDQGDSLSETE